MKYLFLIIAAAFSSSLSGQVIIGQGKANVSSPSISLEFGNENRGIVLPWVNSASQVSNVVNGTMILDITDRKVKVKLDSGWKDLSKSSQNFINTTLQDGITDDNNAKVSIGALTNTAGILVLEDSNKAMQLPMVASPHLNIVNPEPGMIVFDTVSKLVCVYNGSEWNFWKPE